MSQRMHCVFALFAKISRPSYRIASIRDAGALSTCRISSKLKERKLPRSVRCLLLTLPCSSSIQRCNNKTVIGNARERFATRDDGIPET